ncbi:MAG TPA: TetR/AcrR family transcriptional regulator [Verrucomicrobiae bacterium]|nr:TetR/AcrR family transcriptional regulator [Verrucomicrobiae bacterium]
MTKHIEAKKQANEKEKTNAIQKENGRLKGDRKQKILAAGRQVFTRKGFHGATTAEIAKEAGIAEGTIYRYFKTKKDILIELAQTLAVDTLKVVFNEISGREDAAVLEAIIANRLELIRPNLDLARFIFYEAQFHPDVRQMIFGEVLVKAVKMVTEYYDDRVKAGAFRDIDSFAAIRCLIGSAFAYIMFDAVFTGTNPAESDPAAQQKRDKENIELIVDVFLNGVLKRAGKDKGEERA